ncbi:MAG: PAS domain S-box protein, partial [Syntrophales bacterium]|nr:PAS domain S-box protein [Syntrophales bacterium]
IPPICREMIARVKNGDKTMVQECELPRPDGTVITIEATVSRLLGEEGEGLVILLQDVTEIRQLRREIERHHRLAALGDLAAGVAHEIRNPLSSIKGFAYYFQERYGKNA